MVERVKVRIGPYTDRLICHIYTRYMETKYGFRNWPQEQSKFETLLERIDDFVQSVYDVFNKIWFDRRQRNISVRIDRYDTWSMDSTISHIIVPMLKQLRETKHGAPMVDAEDVPEELRPPEGWYENYRTRGETDDTWLKRWDWVLDEMIWAFEQKTIDWEEQYYGEWVEDESKLLGGYHKNPDDEGRKAHQKRMANGFRLFGKYFESLWD